MLATGPILTSPDRFRNVYARIDKLQDETPPLVISRLIIKSIQVETRNQYYVGSNDASIVVAYEANGAPADEGVVMTVATGPGTNITKTQSRSTDVTFTGLDEDSTGGVLTIIDVGLGARWEVGLDIAKKTLTYNGTKHSIGDTFGLPYVWYTTESKLYINSIGKQGVAAATYGYSSYGGYGQATTASAAFTFFMDKGPADQGMAMTVKYSDTVTVNKTASRGNVITFADQDPRYGPTLMTVRDVASNYFWRLTLDMANSRVLYGKTYYYPGEYIPLNKETTENNGLLRLTVSNIKTGFVSLTCNGQVYSSTDSLWSSVGTDLNGSTLGEGFGRSIAMNANGDRIIIGAPFSKINGINSGQITVFAWNGDSWNNIGLPINGKSAEDKFGDSVSINDAGDIIAVGAVGNGSNAGQVRVFSWNGNTWTQTGTDINGQSANQQLGFKVALNSTGDKVAVGVNPSSNSGSHVKVFALNGGNWSQMGSDIIEASSGIQACHGICMNATGDRIAIGAPYADSNGTDSGQVRVYTWNSNAWTQLGSTINGESTFNLFGSSIAMDTTGDRIVIGAPQSTGTGSGQAKIYSYVTNNWIQLGNSITGKSSKDQTGYSVSINGAGNVVAIGGRLNDQAGRDSGHVRVFSWNGSSWMQAGSDILGTKAGDQTGHAVSINLNGSKVAVASPYSDAQILDAGQVKVVSFVGGPKLKDQTFQITKLDGNRQDLYPMSIYVPHLAKTYNLETFIGFKSQGEPASLINSYVKYKNINYKQGETIRL